MNVNLIQKKSLSIIIVVFPILFEYNSGIASLTLADILLIIWLLFTLVRGEKTYVIKKRLVPMIIVVTYMYLILLSEVISGVEGGTIMKLVRYLLYLTITVFFSYKYIDADYIVKIYRICATVATCYLFLQLFFYYVMGYQLIGFLPFLPRGEASDYQTLQYSKESLTTYRPCSFFSEPAIYATYTLGMLVIELFRKNRSIKHCIFFSVGMILSTSSTAVLSAIAIWCIWGIWVKKGKLIVKRIKYILALFVVALPFLFTTSARFIVERLFITGSGITGRFSGYYKLFDVLQSDGLLKLLFGHTMYVDERIEYVPGWGSFLYSFGIVGVCMLVIAIIVLFRHSNEVGKATLICLTIISVGTVSLINHYAMLYLSIAIVVGEKRKYFDKCLNNNAFGWRDIENA